MEKLWVILFLIFTSVFCSFANVDFGPKIAQDPNSVQTWIENLPKAKEQATKLHFYFHDIVDGPNPTAVTVAQAHSTPKSSTAFGLVRVMDNALTDGPDRSKSKLLGHANGLYALTSLEELGLLMTLNFVFVDGSTLSVLGHNPILHQYREIPIVGGSGVYRLARGIATAHTISSNGQNAVVEYNVVVLHY